MSLGKKYICFKCKTKFYDLNKPDPLCPKCGADQRDDPNPDPQEIIIAKYKRPSAAERPAKRPAAPTGEDDEEEEFDDDFIEEAEPGLDEEEEDFGDLDEEPEEAEDEDYD